MSQFTDSLMALGYTRAAWYRANGERVGDGTFNPSGHAYAPGQPFNRAGYDLRYGRAEVGFPGELLHPQDYAEKRALVQRAFEEAVPAGWFRQHGMADPDPASVEDQDDFDFLAPQPLWGAFWAKFGPAGQPVTTPPTPATPGPLTPGVSKPSDKKWLYGPNAFGVLDPSKYPDYYRAAAAQLEAWEAAGKPVDLVNDYAKIDLETFLTLFGSKATTSIAAAQSQDPVALLAEIAPLIEDTVSAGEQVILSQLEPDADALIDATVGNKFLGDLTKRELHTIALKLVENTLAKLTAQRRKDLGIA